MADVPGENRGEYAGGSLTPLGGRFERALSLSRILVVVPVVVLLLSALASFAYGTYVFVNSAVTFVDVVVETEPGGGLNTFYFGTGVAVVIVALTAFLRYGRMDGSDR